MLTKMTKVSRAFEAQYGREPSLADLAAELGVEAAKISDAYEAVFTHRSLDQPMGDSEGATLGDVLEVGGADCVEV
jgi:DNA-directed RNA polymerase sigma subunit (sigma70/sigma32)